MASLRSSVVIGCALASLAGSAARSQQAEVSQDLQAPLPEARKFSPRHEEFLSELSEYDFYLDANKRTKLELRREPVMSHTSPEGRHLELFVWTHRGRPEVLGGVWCMLRGDREIHVHEFTSLAEQRLFTGPRGAYRWEPEEAGITLALIPDAPEPANNAAGRLAQMRKLAQRFCVRMLGKSQIRELRLQPQPVYRYELTGTDSPVVDGAVFVWAAGNDPEFVLQIEARRTDTGVRWQFAPASFTNRELWLTDQNREVWRAAVPTAGSFDGATSRRYGVQGTKIVPRPDSSP